MASPKYSFELKSNLSELETLCRHLNKFGQVSGQSEACITDINICLDELFTNIVSYGFSDDLEHSVHFALKLDEYVLTLKIEDEKTMGFPLIRLKRKIRKSLLT